MKKLLLSTLVVMIAAFGLVSCNNGDYDTDPDTDNSHILNPLDPKNQPGNGLHTMAATINGEWKGFKFATFVDTMSGTASQRFLFGMNQVGGFSEQLSFSFSDFKGSGTYRRNDTIKEISGDYWRGDFFDLNSIENFAADSWTPGWLELTINDEGNDKFRGTFSGRFYKIDGFDVDTTQFVEITDGKFYVGKNFEL